MLPGLGQTHGNEAIPGHVSAVFDHPREGLVWTLYDTPPFDESMFKRLNAACWCPVDHDPVPPRVVSFFRGSQAIPVAMSRYGQEQLAEFDPLYCPHGVDVDVFKPVAENIRAEMNLPEDSFLISMIAANKGRPSRKAFTQAFVAFREFHKRHPNAVLYTHTTLSADYAGGEDLPTMAMSLELPEDKLKYPNQYSMMFSPLPDEKMAEILSASDVLLNASMGEGFGIPIIEAAACGTPAIVTKHSAMPEVAGPGGWIVDGEPFWTGQASWMKVPHVSEIVEALEECYSQTDKERQARANLCRTHALDYAAPKVFEEYMLPAFEEIDARLGDRSPVEIAA